MDFNKLIARYRQFGGIRLIIEYAKIGALLPAIKVGVKCLFKRQTFKQIYPVILKRIEPHLIQRYSPIIDISKRKARCSQLEHKHTKIVWFCWLQGIDQAPPIIKACYNSLKINMPVSEIKIIDAQNWMKYVELPDYIVNKWEKKRIPAALFSDLLRLGLLIKYGGTWVDSTVLCTGFKGPKVQEVKAQLDADLFMFQYTKQGSIPVSISNWFITACTNNEVLIVLRDMLYAYWKDFDCVLDYYIFHLFFAMISKEYPEQIAAMPYGQSQNSLVLLHHWGEKFEQKKWYKLTSHVCVHKLAFRVSEETKKNKESYYYHILNTYKDE